jgi:dipicolinate synthase subunit A
VVFGGNIRNAPYKTVDLLQDETYLAQNAAITAHCALKIILEQLPITLDGCETLLIGWGRISKCLAPMLKNLGANVTIASRKASERAILEANGFTAVESGQIKAQTYRLIVNTAPIPILEESQCGSDAVLIDLASQRGISGDRVIWARGLPGKHAPESSGILIAKTVLRHLGKESL